MSYLQYFIPRIGFPLPVLTLSEQQCKETQSPALRAVLSKLHLNQHTTCSIVHGPEKIGGLNIPTIYFLQCNGQLQLLIGHLRAKDKTANLILISMSKLQLMVGSSTPFFHLKYPTYTKWIESSWLTSIWQWVTRAKFLLIIKRSWTPSIQRIQDIMLMDYFVSSQYEPNELQALNRCRLYLQVLSLTDIVSADGKHIIQFPLNGTRLVDQRSELEWPVQQRPLPKIGNCGPLPSHLSTREEF